MVLISILLITIQHTVRLTTVNIHTDPVHQAPVTRISSQGFPHFATKREKVIVCSSFFNLLYHKYIGLYILVIHDKHKKSHNHLETNRLMPIILTQRVMLKLLVSTVYD